MKTTLFQRALGTCLVCLATPAAAQNADGEQTDMVESDFDLSSTVSVVSDYRFRGISLSNRKPAVQASVDVEHASGLYASVWGSNIARYGGARVEVDLSAGWRQSVGPVNLDLGGMLYFYPDGDNVNYGEIYGFVGKTIGPAELRAGAIYAPSQRNIGSTDNLYLTSDARIGIPGTPVSMTGSVGYEDGAFGGPDGDKWDWSLGGEYVWKSVTLGLQYVDTDIGKPIETDRNARSGLVFSASVEF
jgi:uncharacterized protein (TIGR02001 family)